MYGVCTAIPHGGICVACVTPFGSIFTTPRCCLCETMFSRLNPFFVKEPFRWSSFAKSSAPVLIRYIGGGCYPFLHSVAFGVHTHTTQQQQQQNAYPLSREATGLGEEPSGSGGVVTFVVIIFLRMIAFDEFLQPPLPHVYRRFSGFSLGCLNSFPDPFNGLLPFRLHLFLLRKWNGRKGVALCSV